LFIRSGGLINQSLTIENTKTLSRIIHDADRFSDGFVFFGA